MPKTGAFLLCLRGLYAAVWTMVCGLFVVTAAPGATAAELSKASGQVVLTVAGAVDKTNRPAFDATVDAFLNYHDKSFERAAEFDIAMLEGLGMQRVEIDFEGWPEPAIVEGPWLRDVLAAAGATGRDIAIVALDGYGADIPAADLDSLQWVVGVKRDGRYLGLGQYGPLWIVYRRPGGARLTADDEARWPWSAFYIEVR